MEISLVLNEKCLFTGKKEKFLIGLQTPNGEKIILSREYLEMGLKMLRAIDPDVPRTEQYQAPQVSYQAPPVDTTHIINQETRTVYPQPVPSPRKVHKNNDNELNKSAQIFIDELNRRRKQYLEEHEGEEDKSGGMSGLVIKDAMRSASPLVSKEVMFIVLKKIVGMTQERFEIDYSNAMRRELDYGDE